MAEIFKLFGSIFVDSKEAEESIAKTGQKAEGLATKLGKGLGGAAKTAGLAIGAMGAAAAGAGAAMFATAKKTADYGDKIDKSSQKLGISSKKYQEWEAVLQHSGTSMDNMGKAFQKLTEAQTDASDAQVAAYEKIGLSLEQVQAMSKEDLWAATIEGLQGMEDSAERSALATDLLGSSAKELGPLFNTSAEETQKMIDSVNELGGVMSEDAVKNSAAFNDALQDLTTSFGGVVNEVGAALMPIMTDLMNWCIDHMPEIEEAVMTVMEKVNNFWNETLNPGLTTAYEFIRDTVAPIMIEAFQNFVDFWNDTLSPAFTALYEFVRDTVAPIIIDAFQGFVDFWNNYLSPAFTAVADGAQAMWEGIRDTFGWIADKIEGVRDRVVSAVEAIKAAIGSVSYERGDTSGYYTGTNVPIDRSMAYAKAYDEPYLLDTSTVFGRSGDRLLIGGDRSDVNGGEMIYSHDKLMEDINAASGASALVYQFEKLFEIFEVYFPKFASGKVLYNPSSVVDSTADDMAVKMDTYAQMREW